jgi:hypothetical protein
MWRDQFCVPFSLARVPTTKLKATAPHWPGLASRPPEVQDTREGRKPSWRLRRRFKRRTPIFSITVTSLCPLCGKVIPRGKERLIVETGDPPHKVHVEVCGRCVAHAGARGARPTRGVRREDG